MIRLLFTTIVLFCLTSIKGAEYYAINDGLFSIPSNWSLTSGGPPAAQAPQKGDDIHVGIFDIILDVDLSSEPGISLYIDEGGSLVKQGVEGIYIKTQGFLNIDGYLNIQSVDFKNNATVFLVTSAVIRVVSWSSGTNYVYLDGDLRVTDTLINGGTITGTGTVTAGHYENTGTIFCYVGNPPDGATVSGIGWIGGTPGNEYDWNTPTNWCSNLVPGDSSWVIIESSTAYKDLIITAASQCRSLTLEPGITLTMSPATSLTVADTIWNNGAITLKSTALGSAVLLDNGVLYGTGTYTVELYLDDASSTTSFYHHQVCAPVDNQVLQDFDVDHGFTYAYEFHPATNIWWNIYAFTRPIAPMKGILLSTLNTTTTPNTIAFSDAIVTGDQSVAVVPNGWNLIGNPYPSPISWDNINPFAGVDDIVYIWNPATDNFVSYLEGTGGNPSCQYIQIGQSFFIFPSTATSFDLTNSNRVINSAPYLKSERVNYLKLYTSGGNHSADEVYIRFLEGATKAYDPNLEAVKWPSMSETAVTEIYTVTEDDVDLQVNAMPPFTEGDILVPLHFVPAVSANYTLHTEYMSSFDPAIVIYLEDKLFTPSLMYNLREQGSYSFNAIPGEMVDRFVLHFSDDAAYYIPENLNGCIRVISGKDQFTIDNPEQEVIIEIRVFSITGSEIAHFGPSSSSRETYSIRGGLASYIVRILTKNQVYSRKLINIY